MLSIIKFLKTIISAFYPNVCASCGEIIPEGEFLCDYCFEFVKVTAKDKLCIKCGAPKENCVCSSRAYHFDGITAPFYNSDVVKQVMYAFKFRKRESFVDSFAESMALTVRQVYSKTCFDFCCPVPMDKLSLLKRGYNQSALLASRLGEILKIPYFDNALYAKKKRHSQHSLPPEMRFSNVKGIYYSKSDLVGKTVLLVDDIKTTGATLDECAKVLFSRGADRVYCITAIMSKYKKGKHNGN